MYINKMIFKEADEVALLDNKYGYNVIQDTDYGTREILGDTLDNLLAELENNNESDFDFTKEELLQDLNTVLGKEVVKMLLNGELDFIQVIY